MPTSEHIRKGIRGYLDEHLLRIVSASGGYEFLTGAPIFEKQLNLVPLDTLFKIIRIVEHRDIKQLKRVEFGIFELVRMLYDTGFLRLLTDDECSILLSKINSPKNLLKQRIV